MTYAIVVLPEAQQDADRIFEWIEQRSPEAPAVGMPRSWRRWNRSRTPRNIVVVRRKMF